MTGGSPLRKETHQTSMPQGVNTAVIAAAGHATRMWPASKAIPKELFPLGRVPTIVHLLWELFDAGIRHVILVVSTAALPLMEKLLDPTILPPQKVADDPLVQRYQALLAETEFTIIEQSGNYGNGTPLLLAAKRVGNRPCIYAFGDDVVFGENVSRGLIVTYDKVHCPVLATQEIDPSKKSQFGILECQTERGVERVIRLLEKPGLDQTSSNLASLGRYLVTPELLAGLGTVAPGRD